MKIIMMIKLYDTDTLPSGGGHNGKEGLGAGVGRGVKEGRGDQRQ